MIPTVVARTTAVGTLPERSSWFEFHAEYVDCRPRDAYLAASPGDRGGSIRSTIAVTTSCRTDTMSRVPRMRPQALRCFATLPPVAVGLDMHRRSSSAGWDVFRKVRQVVREIPIIVLGTLLESDTLLLLEPGADDYVCGPFSGRELLARVRVVVRRSSRTRAKDAFAHPETSAEAGGGPRAPSPFSNCSRLCTCLYPQPGDCRVSELAVQAT